MAKKEQRETKDIIEVLQDLIQYPRKTRDGEFYPGILERYQRSERAVIMALYEAYVNGVSTRKMKKITEVLLGKGFSSSSISRYADDLAPVHSMESKATEKLIHN